jgi:hypothetical protein
VSAPTLQNLRLDITDFGAVGDGKTLNTSAIQQALDQIGQAGGGTVFVPPGTWLTGTIELRSGTTLELHPAARLLGSPNLEDYREVSWGQHIDRTPWHLVAAFDAHDITITGGGTIDGNGPAFWEPCQPREDIADSNGVPPGAFGGMDALNVVPSRHSQADRAPIAWIRANKEKRPSPMVEISGCRDVRLQNIHLTNSAGWTLHTHNSHHIWIHGVKLTSNLMGPNNDGFDITGCQDVMVSDCHLSCCDDAICLKTTPDSQPIERVTVSNCVIRTKCAALKFGCAETFHDFRQVTFTNCVVYESSRAVGIYTKRGGNIEDVTISNVVCDTRNPFVMNRPIQIQINTPPDDVPTGRIRNVMLSNVVCRTDGRVLIAAPDDAPVENLVLRDLQMVYPTVDDPTPLAEKVKCGQLPLSHPDVTSARAVVVAKNVRNLVLDNLMVLWPAADADGRMQTPSEWHFDLKACNGMFDTFFERPEFNSDTLPPFALVWAKGVVGGYVSALTASPAPGAERFVTEDCDWRVRE